MKLPDVRDQLHVLAADIEAAGLTKEATKLRALAEETKRRRPFKRSAQKAKPMTAEVKADIRETYRRHPDWSHRQIGLSCGVDGGRVSEVLAGYRK